MNGSRTNGAGVDAGRARSDERRRAARWTPAFLCAARLRAGAAEAEACLSDLSDDGGRLVLRDPLPLVKGSEVELTFTIGRETFTRKAEVIWRSDGGDAVEAGVAFCSRPEPDERIVLDLADLNVDPKEALRIPTSIALRRRVLPICELDGRIVTACADVADRTGLDAVERLFDLPALPQPVDGSKLSKTIVEVHGDPRLAAQTAETDHVAQFDQIMYAAWLRRASDIHVCPERDGVHVQLRVDGQLEPYRILPLDLHAELLSRIKVLAGMDIAERRAPQDGRFTQELPGDRRVDVRVATLPTNHGERATLRLLAIEAGSLTLERLGMSAADLARCSRNLASPHGMILATGPTGCGKTTTLYAALRAITESRAVNAIALQEPVEYDIPGISQVEIDTSQKITFASALRSIMRHDPDVIMIGEIRDGETANIAIKAALTGHLVLATLHTNSAASAVTRLVDMGVARYLIAATLRLVMAQRLVRRLCPGCRTPEPLGPAVATLLGEPSAAERTVYRPGRCVFCAGRGFHGRLGLFELIEVDRELSDLIRKDGQEEDVEAAARRKGMPALADDALAKLLAGDTAVHPVLGAVEVEPAARTTDA